MLQIILPIHVLVNRMDANRCLMMLQILVLVATKELGSITTTTTNTPNVYIRSTTMAKINNESAKSWSNSTLLLKSYDFKQNMTNWRKLNKIDFNQTKWVDVVTVTTREIPISESMIPNNPSTVFPQYQTNFTQDFLNATDIEDYLTLDIDNVTKNLLNEDNNRFNESKFNASDGLRTERLLGETQALDIDQENPNNNAAASKQGTLQAVNKTEQDLISVQSFSQMSFEEIKQYPMNAWSRVKRKTILTISSTQVQPLLNELEKSGNFGSWIRLLDILKNKIALSDVLALIKRWSNQHGSALDNSVVRSLTQCFASNQIKWETLLTQIMDSSRLKIHVSDVMHMRDHVTKSKMLFLIGSTEAFRFQSLTLDEEILVSVLVQDLHGTVDSWKKIGLTLAQYIPSIPPTHINKLNPQVAKEALSILGELKFPDRAHSQPIIVKVLSNAAQNKSLKQEDFQTLIEKMGNLTSFLRMHDIDFLPRTMFQSEEFQHILAKNVLLNLEIGKYVLSASRPREGEWTKYDIIRLEPFFKYGSPQILSEVAASGLLNENAQKNLLRRAYIPYAIDRGELQPIAKLVENLFKENNQWDITTMPMSLFQLISSTDLANLRTQEVAHNMAKFNVIVGQLDILQMMAVVKKIQDIGLHSLISKDYLHLRPRSDFLDYIPYESIENLSEYNQQILLENVPETSPHVKRYVEKKWSKQKITLEDLRQDSILARSLSCETLNQFPVSEIMEIFAIIRMTECPVSYTTSKCLAEKLRLHLQSLAETEIQDDTDLLMLLQESELGIVGGDVLFHFRAEALQEQSPPSKCLQIFSLIGHLPLTILNLLQPHEKKKQIARAALNCIDKQEDILNTSDMTVIGNLMGYLPEISIDKMPADIFSTNLPYLLGNENLISCPNEKLPKNFQIEPCLSLDMRSSIRRKLVNVFGLPESWGETEVRSMGCLISTLFPDNLRQIKDEVLISVADELKLCWNDDNLQKDNENFGVYKTLCQKELLSGHIIIDDAKKQLKLRFKDAALGTTTSSPRLRRASNMQLTCEAIRRTGLIIMDVLSKEELESLSNEELKECLEIIGKFSMTQDSAAILWKKVKKAYEKSAENIDAYTYERMGYIVQGINLTEISNLKLDNLNIISKFGANRNFTIEQLQGLAVQIKADFQSDVTKFTKDHFLILGYIICGFDSSDIQKITPQLLTEISFRLSDQFSKCRPETKRELAIKAVVGFGNPSTWTPAVVTSVGSLIGGLKPSEIVLINGSSFEGLQPSYVKSIPLESIKVLKPQQLGNLSIEAVSFLTQEQLSQLSPEQMDAINDLKSLNNRASTVENTMWILSIVTSLTLLF